MTRKTNIFKSKRFARIARRVSAILAAAIAMSCVATSAVDIVDAGSAAAVKPGDSVNATVSQPTLPLSEYPAGKTYFNGSSKYTPCSHHNSSNTACYTDGSCGCKVYAGGIQCAGFARYAFDQYSHISSTASLWNVVNDDRNRKFDQYGNVTPVAANEATFESRLSSLPAGSYVRVERADGLAHSFIIVSTSSTGVTIYDANLDRKCGVQLYTKSYSKLATDWGYIVETVYHNYSKCESLDSSYHQKMCSTNGCNGYIYEKHSFTLNKNGKFVCSGCGYISTVTPGVMSIEDNDL